MHSKIGECILTMRDMSHSGVFLYIKENLPLESGDVVKIQVQDMIAEAPMVDAEIIRKNDTGIALKYCLEDSH